MHATLEVPFVPAAWEAVVDSTFGTTNINAVTSSGINEYIAVGNSGKVGTSPNGITWTQRDSSFDGSNIYCIAYYDGLYVIGGSSGKMAVSSNAGATWTLVPSSFGASTVLAVTYSTSASLWIAAGGSGKLATSIDGLSWTQRTSSFSTTFINGLYASSSLIVAVGFDGKLATSTNGTSWTQRSSSFVTSSIYAVASDTESGRFVAVGDSGKIAYSANGLSWTQAFPATSFGNSIVRAVDATTEVYVAAGALGKLGTSYDANIWSQRNATFATNNINGVYIDNRAVAVAVGNSGRIAYSLQRRGDIMFSYQVLHETLLVQILYGDNVIDESGPWESLQSAVSWAEAYVAKMNAGIPEPDIS